MDLVAIGASRYLNSNPWRLPRCSSSKSSSAPWWVDQNHGRAPGHAASTCSSAGSPTTNRVAAGLRRLKVVYQLEFPDMGMSSTGSVELAADAGGTKVFWVDAGDLGMNPMNRWFGLFLDGMIGPDFEKGLSNIKKIVEK